MKLKKILLVVLLTSTVQQFTAQELLLTNKDSIVVSSWIFGLGYNTIDDSGDVLNNLFNVNQSWNRVPYPSRVSIGKYFENGLGIEAIAAFSKYNKGTRVDKININEEKEFYSFDARLSYDLNKFFGETGWFDPYVGLGLGYSKANSISRGTFNGVLGFRAWFSDNWGLDVNSTGKWSLNSNATNYKQHAIGVVYRFDIKKELTEKGREKLALINQLEAEKIRINDSIAIATKAEQTARELSENLAKEKEITRLAELEKEKQAAKENELIEIEKSINALEKIYFNFNSSNLNTPSKEILSKLVTILNKYPELIIEITSHTDSRGPKDYNQILSKKRLKSTIDYILENEILEHKVLGKAFGETKLINECDDNTKCSEQKHRQNRRSEIKVIKH